MFDQTAKLVTKYVRNVSKGNKVYPYLCHLVINISFFKKKCRLLSINSSFCLLKCLTIIHTWWSTFTQEKLPLPTYI